jgi:hypothetical protein
MHDTRDLHTTEEVEIRSKNMNKSCNSLAKGYPARAPTDASGYLYL